MNEKSYKEGMEHLLECKLKLREAGYEPIFIALYGAQNYGLEREGSDYDFKAIVMPHLEDLVFNKKPVSTTMEFSNGQVDIKSCSLMIDQWKKGSTNFIELLFSDVQWVCPKYPEMNWFINHREEIAHVNEDSAMRACVGMIKEKHHALRHPYPVQVAEIEKYGYAGKQLSHLLRIYELMIRYKEEPYSEILKPYEPDYLRDIKTYDKTFSASAAEMLASSTEKEADKFYDEHKDSYETNEELLKQMDERKFELIKRALEFELKKEENA